MPHTLSRVTQLHWSTDLCRSLKGMTRFVNRQCRCCCCWLSGVGGGDWFLSHHKLRPSVGPVLNPYPHNGVCMCVYRHNACARAIRMPMLVSAYACTTYASVLSSLCPVYFSSPATLRLSSTTLAIPSQPTHTGRESVDQ